MSVYDVHSGKFFFFSLKPKSQKQEQAAVFMRNHGLATLQRVNEMKPDQEVAAVTAAILGNLAAFSESEVHQSVVHAGDYLYISVYIYINGGYEVIGDCFCLEVCISLCLSKVT